MNPTEYDLLYRNLKEVETSSEEDEDEDFEENINYNNLKYRKKIFNFVIDSNDRDWIETNKETFNIKVKFGEIVIVLKHLTKILLIELQKCIKYKHKLISF